MPRPRRGIDERFRVSGLESPVGSREPQLETRHPKPEPGGLKPAVPPPARPFLKWAGGKTQLLPELERRVPAAFGTYFEPFVGSGALFFHLRNLGRIIRARLSDLNEDLIECYTVVRDRVEDLIAALAALRRHTDQAGYYRIRAQNAAELAPVQRAARLIYLNKTCYNGLYRVNRSGRFNVPYGRYKNPKVCDAANLRACSAALAGVELECAPFEDVLKHATAGDFVYFDPPYVPVSATASFTGYYRTGFNEEKQAELAAVFSKLDTARCRVLLSNSNSPLIRGLFSRYTVDFVHARRVINSNPEKRGKIFELLARNFD
jgi:DNA adenine methylase